MHLIKLFIAISFCIINYTASAQHYSAVNTFTTEHGLPSNHVYEAVQDSLGFLWLATDNGVSRFDGKYFTNFTVKDGLPGNDVIQIKISADGTLWANSYRHVPTYFDYTNSRFTTPPCSEKTKAVCSDYLQAFDWSNKALHFATLNKDIYASRDSISINENSKFRRKLLGLGKPAIFYANTKYALANKGTRTFLYNTNKDTFNIPSYDGQFGFKYKRDLYLLGSKNFGKYNIQTVKNVKQTTALLPGELRSKNIMDTMLTMVFANNLVHVYNTNNLQLIETISDVKNPMSAYVDKDKKIWICTADEGIIMYSANPVVKINLPKPFHQDKILTAAYRGSQIIAGTNSGNVIQINNGKFTNHLLLDKVNAIWNHKLFVMGNNIFTMMNRYYSLNFGFNKNIGTKDNLPTQLKCGAVINDSIIYIGAISGGTVLNIKNNNYVKLNVPGVRIFAASKRNNNSVYFVKAAGLFKDNLQQANPIALNNINCLPNEAPNLVHAVDSNWCAVVTNFNNLIILKNEKPFLKILQKEGLFEGINKIMFHENKIILGGKTGIAIVTLTAQNTNNNYTIEHLAKVDGLPSNNVNDFDIKENNILVATDAGLVQLPLNTKSSNAQINPTLVGIVANNINLPIQNSYTLQANQRNISVSLSGIDVSGHCKHLLYAINDTANWQILESNVLNMQLDFDETILYIKGVNANGATSKLQKQIIFFIKKPFYKRTWFAILATFLILSSIFYYFYAKKIEQQHVAFEKQNALDNQQKQITADLHDDIGATLSSLQLNSNIAKKLLVKDATKVNNILSTIEIQAKELSEKVSDIIWSMKPKEEAFGLFSDRVKTFASQVLDHSNMDYTIQIDNAIDNYIHTASMKKNLIFMVKEAINNAVKYSEAKNIIITAACINKQINITIKDNGIGLSKENVSGNGLKNMQARAAELNGSIEIISTPHTGTELQINIPINA